MSSASPTCIVHSSDRKLVQRIKGALHGHAEVYESTQVSELLSHASCCERTVVFVDALNGDLYDAMHLLHHEHRECPIIIIGEDGSDPILALDNNFVFSVASPTLSNRSLTRYFSVAQHHLETLDCYHTKLTELRDDAQWHAISTPRPGQVIRGLLLAFTGFRSTTDLLERFMEWIQQHYDVSEAGIYLRQPTGHFRLVVSLNDPSQDLQVHYAKEHEFVRHLRSGRLVVHRSTLAQLNVASRAACEKALRSSRAEAIFPMVSSSGLTGWLFVGPTFLRPLKRDDLKELNMITSCLAAFVERSEDQSARLQDAEASQGLLEQLHVAALMLDTDTLTIPWMNPESHVIFNTAGTLPVDLSSLDLAFSKLVDALLHGEGPEFPVWSPPDSDRRFAVAMIGPSTTGQSRAFVLLQDVGSEIMLSAEKPPPELPEDLHPRANLCTKIRDPLVAIKTFIQLLPERRLEPEFCESFVPIITGSIERLEQLMAALERRMLETEETDKSGGEERKEYALRHLLEDVFAEIGTPLEPDLVRNTRDLYLDWPPGERRIFTQHLAHLAGVEGWGRAASARDLMIEWKDLANLEQICLNVRKGDAMAATPQPLAHAALDGMKKFLDQHGGSFKIDQDTHAYTLTTTLPKKIQV